MVSPSKPELAACLKSPSWELGLHSSPWLCAPQADTSKKPTAHIILPRLIANLVAGACAPFIVEVIMFSPVFYVRLHSPILCGTKLARKTLCAKRGQRDPFWPSASPLCQNRPPNVKRAIQQDGPF